jgi:8-hydroxy-5-deazaflavin:NADPH oxidoreductase
VLDLARETGETVKVAIIGTGRMGRGFATALAPKHQVTVGSRDPKRAHQTASKTGAARGTTYAEAAADAEVVILTVPWAAMEETLSQLGELDQTVVVDVPFPYRKAEREALHKRGSSTAEQIQQRVPRARVVKGWNHVHAQHLTAPEVDGIAASVLLAGDDPQAKQTVFGLARDMGFHPVDVGPLKATRELERLVGMMLFVRLGPLRVLSPS